MCSHFGTVWTTPEEHSVDVLSNSSIQFQRKRLKNVKARRPLDDHGRSTKTSHKSSWWVLFVHVSLNTRKEKNTKNTDWVRTAIRSIARQCRHCFCKYSLRNISLNRSVINWFCGFLKTLRNVFHNCYWQIAIRGVFEK